jgi:hypothetical protein
MTRAEVISSIALIVSIMSVVFSVYFGYRDRAHLKATSKFYPGDPDYGPAWISVTIVNAGRRPVILRMWVGFGEKGEWVGTILGEGKSGLRLGEHERHEISLRRDDLVGQMPPPSDDIEFQDLWVEDSLGRRHAIKDAKKNVRLLRDAT